MFSNVVYRQATARDSLRLSVLATQVFLDTYATEGISDDLALEVTSVFSKAEFEDRLASCNVEMFIAELNGNMVGFIELDDGKKCPYPSEAQLEVNRLYVQQAFQRQGIGKALLELANERAKLSDKGGIWLTAWSGNDRASQFYQALGFDDLGATQHSIQGQFYDNRVFARILSLADFGEDFTRANPLANQT